MKKKFLVIFLAITMILIMSLVLCACQTGENDEGEGESTKVYKYSFSVNSVDYAYEYTENSLNYKTLTLKQGDTVLYDFGGVMLETESDTLRNGTLDSSTFKFKLNTDKTFEFLSVNGEIDNLIMGCDFYAGTYSMSIGTKTYSVDLNADGTCLLPNENNATFMPWKGGSIVISTTPTEHIFCTVDMEKNKLNLVGSSYSQIGYVFNYNYYTLEDFSILSESRDMVGLYLSKDGNKAYYQTVNFENPSQYLVFYGTYSSINEKITLTYAENCLIPLVINDNTFDMSYSKTTNGNDWLKIYLNRSGSYDSIYYCDSMIFSCKILSENNSKIILSTMSSDNCEMTFVVNSSTLKREQVYYGNFVGLEGTSYSYACANGSEIIITEEENVMYQHFYSQTNETPDMIEYYVKYYTQTNFDQKAILVDEDSTFYYLDGELYYILQTPTIEELGEMIIYSDEIYYGKDIYISEEYSSVSINLSFSDDDRYASVILYNVSMEYGAMNIVIAAKGTVTKDNGVFTITSSDKIYTVTTVGGVITACTVSDI